MKKQPNTQDHIPFGPEWKKDLMKLKKSDIIDLYRINCQQTHRLLKDSNSVADNTPNTGIS